MAKRKGILSKVGRYLIEIIIIIVGITLSFALSDWDKRRSDNKDYQVYLENLQRDIRTDSIQMIRDRRSYSRKMRGIEFILSFDDYSNQDSLSRLGEALFAINNFVEFLPNNNTFQMLSSTGDFKVFRNKDLVSELIQLYQYDYAYIKMMGLEANSERINHLIPYLINNIYFEDQRTFPVVKTDIPKVIGDPIFRNICITYEESSFSAVSTYERALERLVKVDSMIIEALEK